MAVRFRFIMAGVWYLVASGPQYESQYFCLVDTAAVVTPGYSYVVCR